MSNRKKRQIETNKASFKSSEHIRACGSEPGDKDNVKSETSMLKSFAFAFDYVNYADILLVQLQLVKSNVKVNEHCRVSLPLLRLNRMLNFIKTLLLYWSSLGVEQLSRADPRFPVGGGADPLGVGKGANIRFCQSFQRTA